LRNKYRKNEPRILNRFFNPSLVSWCFLQIRTRHNNAWKYQLVALTENNRKIRAQKHISIEVFECWPMYR
jgi:hypothetical protein